MILKLNFFHNSKIRNVFVIMLLLILYILFSAFSYASTVFRDISGSVFRLHVIANSNSEEDQNLKYIVRDALISYMNDISKDASSKEEAISIARSHMDDFYKIAIDTIKDNGFDYDVKISIGSFSFPTKNYGDISLPAGYYDALKVEIGNASGENWWCVMFPPLCFVDVSSGIVPDESKDSMKENLTEEEYSIISSNDNDIKVKFKIIEMLQNVNIFTAKK